jgi:hypothetical protein
MNRAILFFLIVALFGSAFGIPTSLNATEAKDPMNLQRHLVTDLSSVPLTGLIGLRVSGNEAFLANQQGHLWKIDLLSGKLRKEHGLDREILDFAFNQGRILALDTTGRMLGATSPTWPAGPFPGYALECGTGDVFLAGAEDSLFLLKDATEPARVRGVPLGMPMADGLLWAVRRTSAAESWSAELVDMFGNRMKRVFRFNRGFQPSGLILGPPGPENELPVSYWNGPRRELVLIGQNARMLWKIRLDAPVCRRNLAWDAQGRILILEKGDKGLILNRLSFLIPEG